MILILKATEPTPTAVVPHVRDGRIILPYVADRHRTMVEDLPEVVIEPPAPILLLIDDAEMRKADGEWITVHPNGAGSTGQPVLVRDGTIVGGAGGKLDGTKLSDLQSAGKPTVPELRHHKLAAKVKSLESIMGETASEKSMHEHFPLGPGSGKRSHNFEKQIEASKEHAILKPQLISAQRAIATYDGNKKKLEEAVAYLAKLKGKRGSAELKGQSYPIGEVRETLQSMIVAYRRSIADAERWMESA
jgi:hypothetical protein